MDENQKFSSPLLDGSTHANDATIKELNSNERDGLSSNEVEDLYQKWGYNELPVIEIPLWHVFIQQFMGTMPYMLELAIIIAAAVQDWTDFAIILMMLICNGCLGFYEELKAAAALAELTNKMEKKIACLRDGSAIQLLTRLLVPGDVVLLVGGCEVPADIEWLEGDVLEVDTAALTGEPLPRKYPGAQYGKLILCGSTIRAGEAYGIVRKTGTNTEIGGAQADIMKDKAESKVSVFEARVLYAVKVIILASLLNVFAIFLVQGLGKPDQFRNGMIKEDLLTCLSIIIASIPIALPLVLQITMALGAAKMATDFDSVVTSLPALQDIASMTVLCSDKTGTLTTARISIHSESVWTCGSFTKDDAALYAGLASSRDKKEDAIDRSVINYVDHVFTQAKAMATESQYSKTRSVGFNPIYKRVLFEYTHPIHGKITVAKGLPNKVLDTADGTPDDAADQWQCEDFVSLKPTIKEVDFNFSKAGYKTLGIAVKHGDGPWKFVGILPMLDPPRHDTKKTIENLVAAGIEVKMITGDHLNIAKETARLVGLGVNIYPGEAVRDATFTTHELIKEANGFAQVLPRDKREVVLVLRDRFKCVVGMTGDGVNDAPALSAAQCGIAVDDATDAAKNAAAIILTSPGLSAIYSAVVESRKIFRKLKSYVTYRFAATIQIVIVLTLLILISDCSVNSLFVVLLALFNDLTMLPIAYDIQQASASPENPDVYKLLLMSSGLGIMETGASLLFAYGALPSGLGEGDYIVEPKCTKQVQAAIWLQMFIAAELLIFSARAPTYLWISLRPSAALFSSVMAGNVVVSLMAYYSSTFGALPLIDILLIWSYNIVCLTLIDLAKVMIVRFFEESTDVLPELETTRGAHDAEASPLLGGAGRDTGLGLEDVEAGHVHEFSKPPKPSVSNEIGEPGRDESRISAQSLRLTGWADKHRSRSVNESGFSYSLSRSQMMGASIGHDRSRRHASVAQELAISTHNYATILSEAMLPPASVGTGSSVSLRHSIVSSNSLRPHVPSANPARAKINK